MTQGQGALGSAALQVCRPVFLFRLWAMELAVTSSIASTFYVSGLPSTRRDMSCLEPMTRSFCVLDVLPAVSRNVSRKPVGAQAIGDSEAALRDAEAGIAATRQEEQELKERRNTLQNKKQKLWASADEADKATGTLKSELQRLEKRVRFLDVYPVIP